MFNIGEETNVALFFDNLFVTIEWKVGTED